MKKIVIYSVFLIALTSTFPSWSQLALQCPPCLPVSACDQCWESVEQAEQNGCTQAANASLSSSTTDLPASDNDKLEIENLLLNHLIYPNPSHSGYFTLESTKEFDGVIQVNDQSGRIVLEYKVRGERVFQSSDRLESGLYFVVLKYKDGFETKRLIVIK